MNKQSISIKKLSTEHSLTTIFQILCITLFSVLTYYSIGCTWENLDLAYEYLYFKPDSLLENIFWLALLLSVTFFIIKGLSFLFKKYKIKVPMLPFAAIISIIIALLCIYWVGASGTAPQADQYYICLYADAFNNGDFSALQNDGYVGMFSQQLGIITFLRILFHFFGEGNYTAYSYFSALMAGCLVFSCYQITRLLSDDNHMAEALYLILAFFYAPLYLYVPFIYGEVASISLIAFSAWMLLECIERLSIPKLILLMFACGMAIQLRQNSIIYFIGFFIVLFIKLLKNPKKHIILTILSIFVGIFLFRGIVYCIYADKWPDDRESIPMIAYISVGLNDDKPNPGWYNGNPYVMNNYDVELTREYAQNKIDEFFEKCREDRSYTLDFFTRKLNAQWNAPMCQALAMNNNIANEQSALAEDIYFGDMRYRMEAFMNIYQLLVYGIILFLLVFRYKTWKQVEKYLLLIGIFGGFLFTLIWEAKSRYVFPYFLMMLPYAAIGITTLLSYCNDRFSTVRTASSK